MKCSKCLNLVPLKYLNGEADDQLWAECLHSGWYCPNHSPTSNCLDSECPLCNLGYDCDGRKDCINNDCPSCNE